MAYDFDQLIDRRGTNAMAQEGFRTYLFGDEGPAVTLPCPDDETLSMWVADMAFATAPVATEAMAERVRHPIFGYTGLLDDELFNAFRGWCEHRYGWMPEQEHFVTARGVVPALRDLVDQATQPGEKVLTLTPAYGHFQKSCQRHDREMVLSDLVRGTDGDYSLDLDDFAAKVADPSVRMFFLCHPHNPTGRVWAEDELVAMTDLCLANDVLVVSDEIHCDLLRHGVSHTPLASLFPDADQIITCMSASKTFNLAGLGLANIVIPNDQRRELWNDRVASTVNPISLAATTRVFRDGGPWLEELRTYLDGNFAMLQSTLADELPHAGFLVPDATYLAWVNLGHYFPNDEKVSRLIAEASGLLIEGSDLFVANAAGYIRMNLACPRSVLEDALRRLVAAVHSIETP